ncbi:sensor histidine kinase [Methylogaea oryzae]|uniref:histidine kinase n=1 Tax=Methylogaea oryzae TaxID=1295382 RepID=A0A8D4VL45_9GAMM|nr:HAMP domain-containing sensor histidine kinase [Methylogaea oryzae]BBL70118.1 hypothetical protein MoryE10_07240 [Methylogaea oryzae]
MALFCVILIVALYTLSLLNQEKRLLAERTRETQSKSLAVLAAQVERVLDERIDKALSVVFVQGRIRSGEWTLEATFEAAQKEVPSVSQLVVFNPTFASSNSVPPSGRGEPNGLVMRLASEKLELLSHRLSGGGDMPRTFIEKVDNGFALFAFQRESLPAAQARWVLIRFDLSALLSESVVPLIDDVANSLDADIELDDPDTWNADDDDGPDFVEWPLRHVLGGWMLGLTPRQNNDTGWAPRYGASTVGVAVAVLLTLMLAIYFTWRELRQEQAVVDLRKQFVANVTHELKTPLALIRMYAETLYLDRVREPERTRQYLQVIVRESERLTEMITRVLDFTSHNRGGYVYHLNDVDLAETVEGILASYGFRVEDAGLKLIVDIADEVPLVNHDRHGIMQVLINLLDNAIKYAASGGKITVRLSSDARWVSLAVIDSGPGIPASEVERLRRPFERGHTAKANGGAGLGLALVEQVVCAHGGRLDIEPVSAGGGLSVIARFPLSVSRG